MGDLRRAAVLGGNRIPFARANGPYARASNQDMLTAALDGLIARFGLQNARLGEVAAGAVLKHSRDFNLTREAVLGARLSPWTPAYDVQQACGTGLETTIHVANKITLGQIENGIAAGVDTASDAPIAVNEDLRRVLLQINRARSLPQRLALLRKLRPTQLVPETPRNAEPRTGMSMGEHAAITAREWGITREEQDQFAVASHRNLAAAWKRLDGFVLREMRGQRIPGVSLALTDRTRLLRVKTYGLANLDSRAPLRPDHLLEIGRRQLDATLRWRLGSPAQHRRVGEGAPVADPGPPGRRRDGGGRLRARRRRPADGAGLCGPPTPRAQ